MRRELNGNLFVATFLVVVCGGCAAGDRSVSPKAKETKSEKEARLLFERDVRDVACAIQLAHPHRHSTVSSGQLPSHSKLHERVQLLG